MGSEHLGASVWEDSGQNPGARGLGSSAWRCWGLFPVRFQSPAAVAGTHLLCHWALTVVVFGAESSVSGLGDLESSGLGVEGMVPER